jgi:hypothetical protein
MESAFRTWCTARWPEPTGTAAYRTSKARPSWTGPWRAGDVPFTVLGPTYFYDNPLGGIDEVLSGCLALPLLQNYPLQQLARSDLGQVAAEVLTRPAAFAGRRIELASDSPSADDMSAVLSRVLGRAVGVREVSIESVRRTNSDMGAMWTFISGGGYAVDIPQLRHDWPTVEWTSFPRWADAVVAGPRSCGTSPSLPTTREPYPRRREWLRLPGSREGAHVTRCRG